MGYLHHHTLQRWCSQYTLPILVARRMISEGYMYVIEENQKELHDLKRKKIPVMERDAEPSVNHEKFDRMLSGHYNDG